MFIYVKRTIYFYFYSFIKFKRTNFAIAFGQEMRLTSLNYPIWEFRYFTSVRLDHLQRFLFIYNRPQFYLSRPQPPWGSLISHKGSKRGRRI